MSILENTCLQAVNSRVNSNGMDALNIELWFAGGEWHWNLREFVEGEWVSLEAGGRPLIREAADAAQVCFLKHAKRIAKNGRAA